jgi:hypothetical protein
MATPKQAEAVWPSQLAVPSAVGASAAPAAGSHAPKGKEKAARGPLKLLDLPVDILKEIIHQVRWAMHAAVPRPHHTLC